MAVKIDLDSNSVYGQLAKLKPKTYVKQEPYINNEGIWIPVHEYVEEGLESVYRCVMTKEMFVEAHNKYIKGRRMYKGGWKRRC